MSVAAEKAEYSLHRNDPDDRGYRAFCFACSIPCASGVVSSGARA
ncbi:MAG: hypothetical protein R2864_00125 [Syntrophotaleaceae bacterium]